MMMYAHSCGMPFGITQYIIAFYMPMFFLITGSLWHNDDTPFPLFLKKRIKRIMIPYFTTSFLLYALFIWRKLIVGQEIGGLVGIFYGSYALYYKAEPNIFFFRIDNAPMWFLTTYFSACVLFYLYRKTLLRIKIDERLALLFLLLLAYGTTFLPIYLPWGVDIALLGTVYMAVGKWLLKAIEKINIPIGTVAVVVYAFIVKINPNPNMGTRDYGDFVYINLLLYFCSGVIGTVICIKAAELLQKCVIGSVLSVVGRKSLPILMFHLFVFRVFNYLTTDFPARLQSQPRLWGTVRISVTICLILSIDYIYLYIRRKIIETRKKKVSDITD